MITIVWIYPFNWLNSPCGASRCTCHFCFIIICFINNSKKKKSVVSCVLFGRPFKGLFVILLYKYLRYQIPGNSQLNLKILECIHSFACVGAILCFVFWFFFGNIRRTIKMPLKQIAENHFEINADGNWVFQWFYSQNGFAGL